MGDEWLFDGDSFEWMVFVLVWRILFVMVLKVCNVIKENVMLGLVGILVCLILVFICKFLMVVWKVVVRMGRKRFLVGFMGLFLGEVIWIIGLGDSW